MPKTKVTEDMVEDIDFVSEAEHPHQLHDSTVHTNVDPTSPVAGQAMVYQASGLWKASTVAGGHDRGHSFHDPLDHTDVSDTPPTDGQKPRWNDTTSEWEYITDQSGAQTANELPSATVLGGLMHYPNQAWFGSAYDIQYTRIWLYKDTNIIDMETFLTDRPAPASIRLGLYNQTDPHDYTLPPNAKVAETAVYALQSGDVDTYVILDLLSEYLVPATGYYWVAMVCSAVTAKFAASATFRAGFLPRYEEDGSTTDLPSTAGTLTNPQSAVLFAAVLQEVT